MDTKIIRFSCSPNRVTLFRADSEVRIGQTVGSVVNEWYSNLDIPWSKRIPLDEYEIFVDGMIASVNSIITESDGSITMVGKKYDDCESTKGV